MHRCISARARNSTVRSRRSRPPRPTCHCGTWRAWGRRVLLSTAEPTSFVYNAEYAQGTLTNDIYDWMVATANFAPANKEGGNGLDFFSAEDPRVVMSTTTRTGQDGVTP